MPKPIGAHLTRIYESLDHLLSAAGRGDMTNVRAWGREIRNATVAIADANNNDEWVLCQCDQCQRQERAQTLEATARQMVEDTIAQAKQIVLTPVTFERSGPISRFGASKFVAQHELGNEIVLLLPDGYFGDRPVPQRITIESFVVAGG